MITGDSIQVRGSRDGGMPVLEDPSTYGASLKKAESVGATSLFMGHAFKGSDGDLGPVASGGSVARVFRESLAVHEAWMGAVQQAISELPNGSAGEGVVPWDGLQQARWIAEDAIRRFTAVGAGRVNVNILAEAYLWAGFANRTLGENACTAVLRVVMTPAVGSTHSRGTSQSNRRACQPVTASR